MPSDPVTRRSRRFLQFTLLLALGACAQTGGTSPERSETTAAPASTKQPPSAYERACDEFERAIAALETGDTSGCKRLVLQAMQTLQQSGLSNYVRDDSLGVLEKLPYFGQTRAYVSKQSRDFWFEVLQARQAAGMIVTNGPGLVIPDVTPQEFAAFTKTLREREHTPVSEPTPVPATEDSEVGAALAAGAASTTPTAEVTPTSSTLADASGPDDPASSPSGRADAGTPEAPSGTTAFGDPEFMTTQLALARAQIAQRNLDEARRILEDLLAELDRRGMRGGRDELRALALLSITYRIEEDFERSLELDRRRSEIAAGTLPQGDPERDEAERDVFAMQLATDSFDAGPEGSGGARPSSGGNGRRRGARGYQGADENLVGGSRPSKLDGILLTDGGPDDPPSDDPSPEDLESDGNYGDAADGYRDLLAGIQLRTPSDVDAITYAREGEARCKEAMGDSDGAAELRERNLQDARKAFGDSDPRVQRARRALAHSERARGNPGAARRHQEDAVTVLVQTLPPDHADLVAARLWLSDLLRELGETEAALLVLEQALSAEVARAADLARLSALARDAQALQAQCRFEEAVAARRELVDAERRVLPEDSPVLAESMRELAALLRVSGQREEARSLESRLCRDIGSEAWPEAMRARAAEAASRSEDAQRYPPKVDLTLTPSDPPGQLELVAIVRDPTGVANLGLGIDGEFYDLALRPPQWTADADGMGGRLELQLPDPGGLVTVVTLIAENPVNGYEVQSRALTSDG